MMSKSSFLASLMENNKRRIWVWVLSVLAFMLLFPVYTSLNVNQVMNRMEDYLSIYGALAETMLHTDLINTMTATLGTSILIFLCTVIMAVLSAIQGFSWLYSRKKIDFYMGMPVKRKKRFLVIWLNGILLYVIPYFIGLLISMLIAAGNQGMNANVAMTTFQAFGLHVGVYLCVYHLAILAVMMTGNVVVTGLGFAVFCLYEYIVRMVDYGYKTLFFKYFSSYGYQEMPVFSPFSIYVQLTDSYWRTVKADAGGIIGLIVFAVLTGALSYICYLKRPAEAAGKAVVFEFAKPIIKILLIVPIALLLGLVVADSIGFTPQKSMEGIGYLILTIVLGVIIGSGAIQVIYEFDIRGALHRKRHIVISGILTACIFMWYRYDLAGFDSYVPETDEVESVAFIPSGYETVGGERSYYRYGGEELEYMSEADYGETYMKLTNIADVCELAAYSIKEYDKIDIFRTAASEEETGCWSNINVVYRLKNGRKVYRELFVNVDDERTGEFLDKIIGSEEFKEGYMMGCSEEFAQYLEENDKYTVQASYGNLVYQKKMSKSELKGLLEAYRKDLKKIDFSDIKESTPIGAVKIQLEEPYYGSGVLGRSVFLGECGMNIYPIFENCVDYLKEHGYYMDEQLSIEDVVQIQVINSNSEAYEKVRNEQLSKAGQDALLETTELVESDGSVYVYGNGDINTRVQKDYAKQDEIEQIIPYIYPQELVSWRWDNGTKLEYDYEVRVFFKANSEVGKNYDTWAYYGFIEGKVPEFVKQDTVYTK